MQPQSTISYQWLDANATHPYSTGVSLHSHTSLSRESLSFIHSMCSSVPLFGRLIAHYDTVSRRAGLALDFEAAHWRPPLVPRMAFDLEHNQIQSLGLEPLVSISDHDDIQAPLLLRTIPSARRIPLSVEWTVPFGATAFHLGIHNLPSPDATEWMQRFQRFTASPSEDALAVLLQDLNDVAQILVVFNHPVWDLYDIGEDRHAQELDRFLNLHNERMHAFELNGLRHSQENRKVEQLAARWNQLLISGGDRHGMEPNANINLTDASTFTEFVREIRISRRSHVLYMNQYAQPWEQRILDSTLDAIVDHPHFSPGWQRWDERAFHPDADGVIRPLAEFWKNGRAPLPLHLAIHATRMLRYRKLAQMFNMALSLLQGGSPDRNASRETA